MPDADTALAGTPIRDETAFSIDPATGLSTATTGQLKAATEAMTALGDGRLDEEGYHAVVQHEDPVAAAAALPAAPPPAEEPEPVADEVREPAADPAEEPAA